MDTLLKSKPCCARNRCFVGLAAFLLLTAAPAGLSAGYPPQPGNGKPAAHFPTVPAEHTHTWALLENACALFAPDNKMIDPASGYPFEGWNNDPMQGLLLRSFTQLTAIALWMELLGNVIAGEADTPYLSREQALKQLALLVKTLRQDQHDPRLSADGLLSNFLDLAEGKRHSPLISEVDKPWFHDAFGKEKGEAVWKALQAKGWIVPRPNDLVAAVHRGPQYGTAHFDGPLAPFADPATRERIMALLD
jgi:hypothetical protein